MKKKKTQIVTSSEHLSELLRLASGELTTASMLYWQRLSTDSLPLWEIEDLKRYIKQIEAKLEQARMMCEIMQKMGILTDKSNPN
jgi:hypothetical protein